MPVNIKLKKQLIKNFKNIFSKNLELKELEQIMDEYI
jgi:hypothetical protein